MARFVTLEDFFHKQQPEPQPTARATAVQHYYAYTAQTVDNYGGSSVLNLWSPVPTSGNFSLSQQWYVGGTGSSTQTVEAGWQVFPSKYGTTKPCLFIYWTPDSYNMSGPSSYNHDKPGFVQTDATWVLGGPFTTTSVKGGLQYEVLVQWLRDLVFGHWWLYISYPPNLPTAVGYYPRSLFGSGQLGSNAQYIKYGGEVTGVPASGEMGSGENASAGYLRAAYQRAVYFISLTGVPTTAILTGFDTPGFYTTSLINNSGDPNWGTYFFFGGPSHP